MCTKNNSCQARFIKDPVHDQILLTPRMSEFIDSRAFQRLRNIKQLGTTYYVWAGASHNRFEHCIGVAHLARLMVTGIKERQPELNISERDVECVTLAGLCHDLGHGPWSHVFDESFIPKALPGVKWTHENGSEMMLDFLISDNKITIPPQDVTFIKALIIGSPERCSPDEKSFLFDIVANKRNGFDVDKLDYIQRDSLAIGDPIKLQQWRLIESARVIDGEICYAYKDLDKVFDVYQTRHKLHKTWYHHKTATAIEYMIVDALLLADPFMKIAERIKKPEEFLNLTDDIMNDILRCKDPNLAPAQEVLNRVLTRQLYRCVDTKWVKWEDREIYKQVITSEHVAQEARDAYIELPEEQKVEMQKAWKEADVKIDQLTDDIVIVEQSKLHFGMKEKNPLDTLKFYNRQYEASIVHEGTYSTLRPWVFAEVLLRVFTKEEPFYGIIQKGYRKIQQPTQPGDAPATTVVEVAEGGRPIPAGKNDTARSLSIPPATSIESDIPMSPPVTEHDAVEDVSASSLTEPSVLSRNASASTVPDVQRAPSIAISTTAATAGSSSAPSPEILATKPIFVTPGVSGDPQMPVPTAKNQSKPLSSQGSGLATPNWFTTVAPSHGSPVKPSKSTSKKRDRGDNDAATSSQRKTRSSTRDALSRQSSPTPAPKKSRVE
ncbi:hypothetical protein BDP27DRAFT_316397 [Rhodocollybia butyracea]|uniref:HD domain-containing protein n=1 Tax=Rhodocollybia butyracea TaxID=206335 RepID=A0A9P5PVH0_9AGAR|nr:hypothetical protein BDP27DRAFT_316397 [Rhodocollybia butyracea]